MNKFLGLCIASATLASSIVFDVQPTQAANLTYNWSFNGSLNASGTFVAYETVGSSLSIGDITGQINNIPIVTGFGQVPLDGSGLLSINLWTTNGYSPIQWGIGETSNKDVHVIGHNLTNEVWIGKFSFSPVTSAVPEPLTILGSITAAGFGVAFKRKKSSIKK